MLLLVFLMLLHENLARPPQVPAPKINGEKLEENPKTLVFSPQFQRQQYFHYDFPLLEPQFYGYPNNKPPVIPARVQPQIVLYHHGNGAIPAAPGQSFLLQPGPLQPPGNFLVPSPPQQSPPFVLAGYPKPAHIPPIEKDAEEIPTNPSKIPPLNSNNGRNKPEKLETFDTEKRIDGEIDAFAEVDRLPTNLHPGQRFFILNGEHLYPSLQNYPYPQKFSQFPAARENPGDFLLFNQNPEIFADNHQPQQFFEENRGDFDNSYRLINYVDNDSNSEAVVIDSSNHDDNDDNNNNSESDSQDDITATVSGKSDEQPSVSQAQPGAVAIAGPGGVASAAPRGTAFAGKEGVAVSSPHATAVAGPRPNQSNKEDNNNNNANNKNSNKKGKQQ